MGAAAWRSSAAQVGGRRSVKGKGGEAGDWDCRGWRGCDGALIIFIQKVVARNSGRAEVRVARRGVADRPSAHARVPRAQWRTLIGAQ